MSLENPLDIEIAMGLPENGASLSSLLARVRWGKNGLRNCISLSERRELFEISGQLGSAQGISSSYSRMGRGALLLASR